MPKRRSKTRQVSMTREDSDSDGVLYVGGVRLQMDPEGNLRGFTTRGGHSRGKNANRRTNNINSIRGRSTNRNSQRHQHQPDSEGSDSGSDDDEDAEMNDSELEDYLKNTAAASSSDGGEDAGEPSSPGAREREAKQELEMLRRFVNVELGEELPVVDLDWNEDDDDDEDDDSSSTDDGDDDSWNSGSSNSEQDNEDELDIEFDTRGIASEDEAPFANDNGSPVAVIDPEEIKEAMSRLEEHMLSEDYRQSILATAEQEARLDAAAIDPEIYLKKKKKGKTREKKLRNHMEGVDPITMTVVYERRAAEKREAARNTMKRYTSLQAQAIKLGLEDRDPAVIAKVVSLQSLIETHTDRVEQWPVLLQAPKPSRHTSSSGKKDPRPGIKGAKGGKLAPGEKAALRKQKIKDKRVARAAGKGFDLAWCNKEVQDFVESKHDLKAFPPMGKQECRTLQKLCALYGCKASAQGSGKRRIVMVASTPRTALPTGNTVLQVGLMLAEHTAAELRGVAAEMPQGKARGRWANTRRDGKESSKAGSLRKRLQQPVTFVSSGVMDPNKDSVEVIVPSTEIDIDADDDDDGIGVGISVHKTGVDIEEPGEDSGEIELLDVYVDRGNDSDEGADDVPPIFTATHTTGLGSRNAFQPRFGIGVDAEGVTNSGRVLGLGMALGMGPEMFSPIGGLAAFHQNTVDNGDEEDERADLSPLQRKLSRSEVKRQAKLSKKNKTKGMAGVNGLSASAQYQVDEYKVVAPRSGGLGLGAAAAGLGTLAPSGSPEFDVESSAAWSGSYAAFERHTTGIGSKLLSKWGFSGEGAGLGREGEGRAEPIFVKKRSKGLGLGA